jgi:uncharacterized protein (TIGR02118 family)
MMSPGSGRKRGFTMFLMFARFDFKSPDLAAEDKNYFDHHVRLARQLPGVRMYLTGRLAATAQGKPDRYRAVLFGYDTPAAGLTSLDCPIGAEMMADSAEHIEGTVVDACEGEVFVPFNGRAPGQQCLVAVLMYDRAPSANESRWLKYRDSIRNLPGAAIWKVLPSRRGVSGRTANGWKCASSDPALWAADRATSLSHWTNL